MTALIETRLYWAAGAGVLRAGGHEQRLQRCPRLAGQEFEEIDYVPDVLAQVRCAGDRRRDMTPAEIQAARELLGLSADTICLVFDNSSRYRRGR